MMTKDKHILLLDGSTEVCSVALASESNGILARLFESAKSKQSECLAPMVNSVLASLPKGERLDAVVVAEGPGSYTGLRIVAGYAKGLCMARQIPLYTMTTTELMALTFIEKREGLESDAVLLPMIDARRMEVYTALYDANGNPISEVKALILTDEAVQRFIIDILSKGPSYFFGSGSDKAINLFNKICPLAQHYPGIFPDASAMIRKAFEMIKSSNEMEISYWEPFYLKEYQAKVMQRNKVLERLKMK